ncbi:uncharacterized protein [Procambarus clarkii]|uniref:uncharacterized protein n=1 Tax=Procambarus clarkii TaxID=6728 RepID=UPI00374371E9
MVFRYPYSASDRGYVVLDDARSICINRCDSKVVWTPNLVRQVKRAFRIVRRDEDGRNCVRRGKRPPLLLTLCSTIDLCTPNTSNCRRTGWRGRQTPIAPTLSAHNLLNFAAPSQLKLRDAPR